MRIELISLQCECSILPLDYGPEDVSRETSNKTFHVKHLERVFHVKHLADPVLFFSHLIFLNNNIISLFLGFFS